MRWIGRMLRWIGRMLCWLGRHKPDHPDNFSANCTRCGCEMIWYSEWFGGEFGSWERRRKVEDLDKFLDE